MDTACTTSSAPTSSYFSTFTPELKLHFGLILLESIRMSNTVTTTLLTLISSGTGLEAVDEHGRTPLLIAVAKPALQVVEALLAAGANVGARDLCGRTPLHYAASLDCRDIVVLLLQAGSELSASDSGGNTPLHCACECSTQNVVQALVQAGAKVSAHNYKNRTPLMSFAAKGALENMSVLHLLLSAGAKLEERDKEGNTCLYLASIRGAWEIVWALSRAGANTEDIDAEGNSLLHIAAGFSTVDVVKQVIENSVALDGTNRQGMTPLLVCAASSRQDLQVMTCLLDNGASVTASDQQGNTALMLAVKNNWWVALPVLLAAGANPEAADCQNYTALSVLLGKPHNLISMELKLEVAARLVASGADISKEPSGYPFVPALAQLSIINYDVEHFIRQVQSFMREDQPKALVEMRLEKLKEAHKAANEGLQSSWVAPQCSNSSFWPPWALDKVTFPSANPPVPESPGVPGVVSGVSGAASPGGAGSALARLGQELLAARARAQASPVNVRAYVPNNMSEEEMMQAAIRESLRLARQSPARSTTPVSPASGPRNAASPLSPAAQPLMVPGPVPPSPTVRHGHRLAVTSPRETMTADSESHHLAQMAMSVAESVLAE